MTQDSYLLAVSHYDLDGRVVRTIRQHWQGGATGPDKYDLTESRYRFTGELQESTRRHYNTPGHQLTQALHYRYDHMGRRRQVKQQLTGSDGNTLSQAVASRYDYNETGQLYKKYLHSPDYASAGIAPEGSFLYPQTYSYNARGWLREISSGEFSQTLNYESGGRYNGDITSQYWTIGGTGKTFSYSYDALSRLTSGTSPDMSETGISYDPLGNILSLSRDGQTISYDYVYGGSRGNRLASVSGSYFGETKYYAYDENGNMTRDDSRGISSVSYDHLNLPRQVSSTTGTLLSYHYTATGEKLRSYNSHTGTTTDYVSGIQYENDELKVILTEEGQARRSGDSYNNEYWVKDHLGNTRVAFYRNPSTGQLEVLQREDYYPFGKNKPVGMQSSNKTNYLYNGKELQEEIGWYDYGFRSYDAETARWNVIDMLAELHFELTPYNYVMNNPINYIDPFGLDTLRTNQIVPPRPGVRPFDPRNDVIELDAVVIGPNNSPPTPTPEPTSSPTPRIQWGPNANRRVVSQHSINLLHQVMISSGNPSITITSTQRTPEQQANIMYRNITTYGLRNSYEMYANPGDQVTRVAERALRSGASQEETIRRMLAEIYRLGPQNISRHTADPAVLNVIDISPNSIRRRAAFIREVRVRGIHLIPNPPDPAFHLEITQ